MYCGRLKEFHKDLTIGQLINILEPYKDLKVKVSGQDSIYIHFDQSGDYIDLNQLELQRLYGREGISCLKCSAYKDGCKCSGKNCMCNTIFSNIKSEHDREILSSRVKEDDEGLEEEIEQIPFIDPKTIYSLSVQLEQISKEFAQLYKELKGGK